MLHAAKLESLLTAQLSRVQREMVVSPLYKVCGDVWLMWTDCGRWSIMYEVMNGNPKMFCALRWPNRIICRICVLFYRVLFLGIVFIKNGLRNWTKQQRKVWFLFFFLLDCWIIYIDRGSLHGIPIAVKDNFCTTYPATNRGEKTTAGSKILESRLMCIVRVHSFT